MGTKLSVEEAVHLTVNDLGVEQSHVHCWRSNNIIKSTCLVEEKWLQDIRAGTYHKPHSCPGTSYERFLLLQPSNEEVPKGWTRASLKIFRKPLKQCRIPSDIKDNQFQISDSFADLMSYVSAENFKNYLLQASRKYSAVSLSEDTRTNVTSGEDVLFYFAKHVHNLEIIELNGEPSEEKSETSSGGSKEENVFQNEGASFGLSERSLSYLMPVYGVVESHNAYFIIEPFTPHSLQDVVWFSPSIVASTIAKPLFLLYQILKLFETFHKLGYYCNMDSLQDILLQKSLWLFTSTTVVNLGEMIADEVQTSGSCSACNLQSPTTERALNFATVGSFEIPIPVQIVGLPLLVDMWVRKELSNFDYLMALNQIAGRRLGDPNYHPVLPWVTDFTRAKGNFRDLTKSKFRINKGDHQLDLTYNSTPSNDPDGDFTDNPPHHVSGVLSEITYHVYLARRTPKSVLQKHVRAKWEPNEYPSNMQRLQEWTPDECIPEFYADPTIFKSIHADLPDLGVPEWATSPDEFVRLHRQAMESEYVCSHLHHWIDLTFGYKLMGTAAVRAKNVYLHLVDNHQTIVNHGVLQLFEEPHPSQHRHHEMVIYPSTVNFEDGLEHEMHNVSNQHEDFFGTLEGLTEIPGEEGIPSNSWDNVDLDMKVETGEDELTASKSSLKKQKRGRPNFPGFLWLRDSVEITTDVPASIDSLPISLPIGYDPLEEFDEGQLLTKFKLQCKESDLAVATSLHSHSKVKALQAVDIPTTARHKEIQNLCSIITEMFVPAKMRLVSSDLSQKEKFIAAKRVFNANKLAIPGFLRDGVKTLFDEGCGFNKRHGLAPLTPELLLQPYVNLIPFPPYFKRLYEFLVVFHTGHQTAGGFALEERNGGSCAHMSISNEGSYSLRQVDITVEHLPELLADLNEEGLDLLMSYLNPLFCFKETQLQSFLQLFDPLAMHLGPKKARRMFLKLVLKQYDVCTSSASVVLFHQSFLSKLIMRFGMEQFLSHFITFIVDALNLLTKDVQVNAETGSQDDVQGAILEDEKESQKNSATETDKVVEVYDREPRTVEKRVEEEYRSTHSDTASSTAGCNGDGPLEVSGGDSITRTKLPSAQSVNLELEKETSHTIDGRELIPNSVGYNEVSFSEVAKVEDLSASAGENSNGNDDEGGEEGDDDDDEEEETIERNEDMSRKRLSSVVDNSVEGWYNDGDMETQFSLERSISFQSDNPECLDGEEKPVIDGEDVNGELEIPEAAAESLCWLAPRLGPLLTSNYITKQLLQMLIKCYVGVAGLGDKGALVGDGNAKWILHCLGRFTEIYGEAIIVHQYLPFISSKINIVSENVSMKGEANLAGALVLVRHCVLRVSRSSLLEQFEVLCHQILHQVLCLLSSNSISFASGAPARTFLSLLIIEILIIVCDTLERKPAQEVLASLIQTFFSSFDKVYGISVGMDSEGTSSARETILELQTCAKEIQETFTASLAYHAYIGLCKSLGDTYMEATLCNYDMIWQLCCSMDEGLSNHAPPVTLTPSLVLMDDNQEPSPQGTGVDAEHSTQAANKRLSDVFAERSYSPTAEARKDPRVESLERSSNLVEEIRNKSSFVSSRQHLAGNWLKYWKHHLGKRNRIDSQSFSQLKLQTFTGHSDAIKDLYIHDSEHLFLSASKDKTVKLWSLSNHGDGTGQSASSWTAYDHRKPVFAIDVVDVMRQAVSCDGSVHIWDLATGTNVLKLNFPKSNQAVAMTTLPSPNSCVVVAMQNSSVRFIDAREGNFGHSWKVTSNNLAGMIRCMCVNFEGTWIAAGFSSGHLSVLDLRGGILKSQWKAHETDVIKVKAYTNSSLVSSSSTQKMDLWGQDSNLLASLPSVTGESVQNICVYDKVIVSCTGNNRIGWHTFNEKEPAYSSVRLRNDAFKGNLTCFGVLPLNRSYLFGSDNGNITIMA